MELDNYLKSIFIVYKHERCEACMKVSQALDRLGFKYRMKLREKVSPKDFEKEQLVIVVGGDGTILKTCSFIRNNSIVFGVNSYPILTEGFLTRADMDSFEPKFKAFLAGKIRILSLPRLKASINGEELPELSLNEVSISRKKPYQTLMYSYNNNVEKATGIIVSTPLGSTAWCTSAGGKRMPLSSDRMQFVVREPYSGKIFRAKEKQGMLDSFTVKLMSSGIIVFDSIDREYPFKAEDIVKVGFSGPMLRLVDA